MLTSFVVAAITASAAATKLREDSALNLEQYNWNSDDISNFFDNGYENYYNSSYDTYADAGILLSSQHGRNQS